MKALAFIVWDTLHTMFYCMCLYKSVRTGALLVSNAERVKDRWNENRLSLLPCFFSVVQYSDTQMVILGMYCLETLQLPALNQSGLLEMQCCTTVGWEIVLESLLILMTWKLVSNGLIGIYYWLCLQRMWWHSFVIAIVAHCKLN